MKVGLIVESGPDGADGQVLNYFADRLATQYKIADFEVVVTPLDNKKNLIQSCGDAAFALLELDACDQVVIIWDLKPAWPDKKHTPCRKKECDDIWESLKNADVDVGKVELVCIEMMLEAWLVADGRALADVLSTKTRRVRPNQTSASKTPETEPDPKSKLITLFKQKRGRRYEDYQDAIKIAQAMPDLGHVSKRCPTFKRFAFKTLGVQL